MYCACKLSKLWKFIEDDWKEKWKGNGNESINPGA